MQWISLKTNKTLIDWPHIYIFGMVIVGFHLRIGWQLDFSRKTLKIYTIAKILFLIKKIVIINKICKHGIKQGQ